MDDSRDSFLVQFTHTPLTALTALGLLLIWFPLWNNRVSAETVAFSYTKVLEGREYWRLFTAALSHLEFFHLVFNMTSLWSCRAAELMYGSWDFFKLSIALLVSSKLITLAIYHVMITQFGLTRYAEQMAVGYSAVIFGWMTVLCFTIPGDMSVMGMFDIPGPLAPFFSLFITQVLVRSASFVGHFAGILAGFLVLSGAFSFLRGVYWTVCFLFWVTVVIVASVRNTTAFPVPCIDYINFQTMDINSMRIEEEEEEEVEEELLLQGLAPPAADDADNAAVLV